MASLKASKHGLEKIIHAVARRKDWSKYDPNWCKAASEVLEPHRQWYFDPPYASGLSLQTWKRFLSGEAVRAPAFKAFSHILELDWQEICEHAQIGEGYRQPFYIERISSETKSKEEIVKPGALIRIKAPQKMGKSALVERVLEYARIQEYRTVKIDFQLAENSIFLDLKTFLMWFCVSVSDGLELEDKLDDYWKEIYGLNKNCTRYFQKYLFSTIDNPLVLALDNFEMLFESPVFGEFCKLLRGWHDTAKQGDQIGNLWKKLRLVVVHSTEVYRTLDINCSPFNVGVAIELPEFTLQEVENLADQYQLGLDTRDISALMTLLGGHPSLIQQALAYLREQPNSLRQFLTFAPTEEGPFSDHLRRQLWALQQIPQLEAAFRQVVTAETPVLLDSQLGFKLHSLGLVKLRENSCVPSCELYHQYFSMRLQNSNSES
jgi:hypothetical protein